MRLKNFLIILTSFALNTLYGQIANGWAYGMPLQTGENYRIINIKYMSCQNIKKGYISGYDWSPAPKQNTATSRTFSFTNQTQSEVSINGGMSVSPILGWIGSSISATAALIQSRSIQDQTTATVNIPSMKQVRPVYYEQRKGYTATLVVIRVIGSPTLASTKNKTMTIQNYPITGSEYVDTYIDYEWR